MTVRPTAGKLIALGVAAVHLVLLVSGGAVRWSQLLQYLVFLLLALVLVWFPGQIGEFTGYVGRGGGIDVETPAILVSLAGWFFLVGLPAVLWLLS
ncbi:MAG: hypothetical protein GXY85_11170 [Candidatus Brocadiaceae bacterium]|nr:hypothetical protein [Candidatus Brocadiaceae bacterium]